MGKFRIGKIYKWEFRIGNFWNWEFTIIYYILIKECNKETLNEMIDSLWCYVN